MNDKIYSILSDMDAIIADVKTIQAIIASNVEIIPSNIHTDSIDLVNRVLLTSADDLAALTNSAFTVLKSNETPPSR